MQDNRQFTFTIFFLVVFVLFIANLFIPFGNDILLINGHHHVWLDLISPWITELGNGLFYLPFFILMLFHRFRWAFAISLAGILHGAVVLVFKRLLFPGALRPAGLLNNPLLHFVPGIEVHTTFSFPSGHTATAFAFLLTISLYLNNRWFTLIFAALALLTGLSRVYLLQHFLIDVAAGAAIGTISAWTAWQIIKNKRWPWLDWRLTFSVQKANELQGSAPAQG
jgi:membrane-associated phospholipid phosphatase